VDGLVAAEDFCRRIRRQSRRCQLSTPSIAGSPPNRAALRRVATLVAQGVGPLAVFGAVAEEMRRCVPAVTAGLWRFETDGEITIVAAAAHPAALKKMAGGHANYVGRQHHCGTGANTAAGPARIDSYDNIATPIAACVRAVGVRAGGGRVPIIVDGRVWGALGGGRFAAAAALCQPITELRIGRFAELTATAVVAGLSRRSRSSNSWLRGHNRLSMV